MATPGNGPRPYCRSTFAPARKVSPGYTGTLLACTSEQTIDPTTDSTNGSGSTLSSGAIAPSTSMARSSRPWHIRAWISPMRAAGSAIPTGAASITPPKRFPPAGASSERRFQGTAIGRESGLLDRAIDGHGAVVSVVGPPGIGKTRLAGQVVRLAQGRGVEVFSTFCESHATDVPFRVVARLL